MSISADPIELARAGLRKSLAPFFTTKSMLPKLDEAVEASLREIQGFLRVEPMKNRMGATVMTEGASTQRGDGSFPIKPRSM